MKRHWWLSLLLLATANLPASPWQDEMALRDSLSRVHPRMRASWLKERGLDDSYYTTFRRPDSQGLREVGRWSFGPSYDVDGRVTPSETLVALARGSGVSLLRFSRQDSLSIELLSDINAPGLLNRVWVRDTLLYVGSAAGLEIWNIADERNPARLSGIQTALNDFDVQESLAYVIGADDSFKVYNVSDPANPASRGACRDSGYVISVCNGYAYVGDRWGLYVIDARNPASPNRVASWGSDIISVKARGNICCATLADMNDNLTFYVLDVRQPASITPLGSLADHGGYDLCLDDSLVFVSGDYTGSGYEFQILSIGDSLHPRLTGQASTLGDNWGVWGDRRTGRALVADMAEGLQVFDITVPGSPTRDTTVLAAGSSHDVAVRGNLMAVANEWCGMKLVGIADPARPVEVGSIDSFRDFPATHAVVLQDSFAFMGRDLTPYLRTVWVGDSSRPQTVGGCPGVQTLPEDMVLMDTLLYIVGRLRFNIVNVARPREPVLVGWCMLPGEPSDLCLVDTVAYASRYVVSVARPGSPVMLGSIPGSPGGAIAVRDSFAFAPAQYDSLVIVNVARPSSAFRVASLVLSGGHIWNTGAVLVEDSILYIGGDLMHIVNVANPLNPQEIATWRPPRWIRRVIFNAPYVYAACYEAGVCVLETVQVGVMEPSANGGRVQSYTSVRPVPATATVVVSARAVPEQVVLRDVAGREVRKSKPAGSVFAVDLVGLRSGLYFCELKRGNSSEVVKFIKQ